MRDEPVADKIVLSKEDYIYYQQLRKACRVYGTDQPQARTFYNKKKYKKRF